MQLKKLSKFLPGFLHKPGKPKSKPVLTVIAPEPKPAPVPVPEPEPSKPTKSQKILDDLCAFLARYLHCSQDQRTVLALWILHTWWFSAARSSPYLAIQSSRKLSGKTLCLRLLSLLCSNPALTSGYTASALVKRIHSNPNQLPTFPSRRISRHPWLSFALQEFQTPCHPRKRLPARHRLLRSLCRMHHLLA